MSAVLTVDGHLDATIATASETYHVEPASRYFGPHVNVSFPGVIYKVGAVHLGDLCVSICDVIEPPPFQASDVLHPHWNQPSADGACASHQLYLNQLERTRHDADAQEPRKAGRWWSDEPIDRTLYSGWLRRDAAAPPPPPPPPPPPAVPSPSQRRGAAAAAKRRRSTVDPRKITCMLYLQADHLFYRHMQSEEACIETMTRHVQRVNAIYKNIGLADLSVVRDRAEADGRFLSFLSPDFDGDGRADEINFMIKRIKVHTTDQEAGYRFKGNYGVEKYLERFSGP